MKLSELYAEYFANWISKGSLISKDKISVLGMRPLFDRFITHEWITKVWAVRALPVEFDLNLTDLIREEMFRTNPKVKTIINITSVPVHINVRNNVFMRQFEAASSKYHELDDFFNELTEEKRSVGVAFINPQSGKKMYLTQQHLNSIKEEYESYLYIHDQVSSGHTFTNTYYFIQASAKNKRELNLYTKNLNQLLDSLQVFYTPLHGNLSDYLACFCPAGYVDTEIKKFPSILLSDENLAGLTPYKTLGLVGGSGVLVGEDVMTRLPFLLDFFGSGTAQVCLLLGKSGCGKTRLAFTLAMWLAGVGLHFSAIDIKGNEWSKLGEFVDMLIIGMGDNNSKFVNTLRLDDLYCENSEDAATAYSTAVRGTVSVFEIVVNLAESEGNVADLRAILDKAVIKVFKSSGVVLDNPATFSRTASLKYSDVIDVLSSLQVSASYTEQQKKLCQLIITRTSDFFLPGGRYADAFQNELSLNDVLTSTGVIYDFNKNADVMLDSLDSLRVFMVQFLDGKKQAYRKKQGLHTAAFYEELQRCQQFGILVDEISHKVTGSRSSNVIIFLLANAVGAISGDAFSAIKSNITTKIIGKVVDGDIQKLISDFDCGAIEEYMGLINENEANAFSHCFAIQYDTGLDTNKLMFKSVIPDEMENYFRTRDTL